jgi:hypothetical protein
MSDCVNIAGEFHPDAAGLPRMRESPVGLARWSESAGFIDARANLIVVYERNEKVRHQIKQGLASVLSSVIVRP